MKATDSSSRSTHRADACQGWSSSSSWSRGWRVRVGGGEGPPAPSQAGPGRARRAAGGAHKVVWGEGGDSLVDAHALVLVFLLHVCAVEALLLCDLAAAERGRHGNL